MANKIVCNEDISFGQPRLNGRRLTVWDVVSGVFNDSEFLEDHEIHDDELKECLNYCSNLLCQKDPCLINFCSGCILSTINNGNKSINLSKEIELITEKYLIEEDSIYFGSKSEHDDEVFGLPGWLIAERIKNVK